MNHNKIGALNVRGLREKTKRNEMFTWLKNMKLSIIFYRKHTAQANLEICG